LGCEDARANAFEPVRLGTEEETGQRSLRVKVDEEYPSSALGQGSGEI
jgi:hypothetical protein